MTDRAKGLRFAAGAAGISGVAVFVNAYGVKAVPDATVYTTAKNVVAAALLVLVALAARRRASRVAWPARRATTVWLVLLGAAGGSVPFVLFFEGLARASSTQTAFLQKSLLIWVAVLAVPLLGERLGAAHLGAIGLLVAGQVALSGGLSGLHAGAGEALVLAATLLWAVETVAARALLREVTPVTLGVARMGLGAVVLLGWLAVTGRLDTLAGLGRDGWAWALFTGAILAAYVSTWLRALALAPAVDVTAMLVPAAVLTGLLNVTVKGTPLTVPAAAGMTLLCLGAGLLAVARRRRGTGGVPARVTP